MKTHKTSLVGKSLDDFVDICDIHNVERYRAEQIFNWIYKNKINDFESLKNIPKSFLKILKKQTIIHPLTFVRSTKSNSGLTNKFLLKTQSGLLIESVLMNEGSRTTLCLSNQVGCALDCKFCATAKMGFIENLDSGEIVDQSLLIS